MATPGHVSSSNLHSDSDVEELRRLAALGPDAQGDVDWTLIEANLKLSPRERIEACQQAAAQVQQLQTAMREALNG